MVPNQRIVASTTGADPRKVIIGTSPFPGDVGYTGIVLPAGGSATRINRILVRLCAIGVPDGAIARVVSLGQLLTIAGCIPAYEPPNGHQRESDCDAPSILLERPVVTPWWSFPDGNVSWHLRFFQKAQQTGLPVNLGVSNYDADTHGIEPAILATSYPPIGPFVAANAAMPPGDPIGELGIWHDLQFTWEGTPLQHLALPEVRGPGVIGMFATVFQTNPATRVVPALGQGPSQVTTDAGVVPEDLFWLTFHHTARYYRIGGRMIVEYCCEQGAPCLEK